LQAFNWESWKEEYYKRVAREASWYAELGFTYIWLPPAVRSVSEQGYMPNDYFDLNSEYGTEEELRTAVAALKEMGLRVMGDCVLNHRCALHQDENGVYNRVSPMPLMK
jgi:alpha-amylase